MTDTSKLIAGRTGLVRPPDKVIAANSTFGLIPYSLQSPFGFNGRYYYARAGYSW